ncbi:uncharacterized protein [Triticum aestivum]|uniref:uncharacterized protein isoform X5 n=1 Tax=Triticum aestivum TaxID=4565 RepID=UPI001D00BC36|nr:uncharacterized protein LOC123147826 isoform X5 [Triticum aestivum]
MASTTIGQRGDKEARERRRDKGKAVRREEGRSSPEPGDGGRARETEGRPDLAGAGRWRTGAGDGGIPCGGWFRRPLLRGRGRTTRAVAPEPPRSNHGCSAFKVYKADLEWFPRKLLLFPTSRDVLHLDCFLQWQEGFHGGTESEVQTIQCSSSNTSKVRNRFLFILLC